MRNIEKDDKKGCSKVFVIFFFGRTLKYEAYDGIYVTSVVIFKDCMPISTLLYFQTFLPINLINLAKLSDEV